MRKEEAKYVGQIVTRLADSNNGPVLNLGSSTEHFRKVDQSHIHEEIFAPLEDAKIEVVHSDLKDQDGVDLAGDLFDPQTQKKLTALKPQILLVCNLMEHLPTQARTQLPHILNRIIDTGGFLVVTVPLSYPLHFDPIDTYYRPTPEQLRLVFPSYKLIEARVIVSSTFLPEFGRLPWRVQLKLIVRLVMPFYRPRQWLGLVHRFTFLFRHYKVSCVVLQNPHIRKH